MTGLTDTAAVRTGGWASATARQTEPASAAAMAGAWALCAVTLALAVARVALAIADPASSDASSAPKVPGGGTAVAVFEAVVLAAIAVLGALVASRRPRNPVGWILCVIPISLGLLILSAHIFWSLALAQPMLSGTAKFAAWLATWVWIPAMVPALTLFPLLFPTGRPPSRRWRWVIWAALGSIAALLASTPFQPGPFADYPLANPVGAQGGLATAVGTLAFTGFVLMAAATLGSVTSLVVRFRRSRGEERQQLKWVTAAAALFVVIFITPTAQFAGEDVGFATLLLGLLIVAVAVAIAVLRYRLYDIDIVINRSLVFVVLAGFITAVYAGVVVGLGRLLPVGENNLGLAVVATALVAVAFEPVRVRVQHWANRLVYGHRATPYETLAAMSSRIGSSADPDLVLAEAARLLAEGTGAGLAVVWVAQAGWLVPRGSAGGSMQGVGPVAGPGWGAGVEAVALDGAGVPLIPGADLVEAVHQDGQLVGALSLAKRPGEGVSSADRRLVGELAGQAALLLANTRLRSRLRDRLAELRASRQRMLAAQDRARRGLERDLHDGAQQELVALKIKLGLARTIATKEGSADLADRMLEAAAMADQAVDTLRDVARGIYPPLLESEGLGAALSAQARRAELSVTVLDRGTGRYPREVEATAYFVAVEALGNAVRHAHARHAHIELDGTAATLTISVTDDGDGFDPDSTQHGSGLTHMTDRGDSAGGTLSVASRPGHGTTITLTLPIPVSAGALAEGLAG